MKIDLQSIDREQFDVSEYLFNGEKMYLVQPQTIGSVNWNKNNLIFRSSVWNVDGALVSASFPKFFNWGEQIEMIPLPKTLDNTVLVEKLDGSTMIVSKYKGNFMIRTRGTIDASGMEKNGHEVAELMAKYPLIKEFHSEMENWNFSLIFEWISPLNQIVINYTEADIRLVGAVLHDDYLLYGQSALDVLADLLNVKRPQTFNFNSVEEMVSAVENLKGQEGIVVYFNGDQSLLKVKSVDYLSKHRFKSHATLENTLELYFAMGKPSYQEFEKSLIEQFDYECFGMVRGFASQICESSKEVNQIILGMESFVAGLFNLPRKDAALKIISSYGKGNSRGSMCFTLLDRKPLHVDQLKKLYWQILKK
jgi:hypothetical protein